LRDVTLVQFRTQSLALAEKMARTKANLLPNFAVSDTTAHNANDPLLNLFNLDVHVLCTLVEGQDSLRLD
jgi:hypothetical protein